MRLLCIDHGDRRFGLAISDPGGSIAFPLDVVEGEDALLGRLPEIVAEREVDRVVVGLPLNMDGSTGPRARRVLEFRDRLEKFLGVEVEVWDERLTTMEAERVLALAGEHGARRRARVDKVAAQIILQSYIDAGRAGRPPER